MNNNCFNIEDYLHRVKSFHGHVAPGVVIGGFMVHLARTKIPEGVLFDAISETPLACLTPSRCSHHARSEMAGSRSLTLAVLH